jgi:haloalkane dehalogenase
MNTALPDGTQEMPAVWHEFKETVENAPELDIGRVIEGGCAGDLAEEVRRAYEAPFHTEASKAGARTWPGLIPLSPSEEGADTIREARDRLAQWEKPAFVLFSDSDPITGPSRDPLWEFLPTASDQPDTWIEGAGHFLQEDAGERVAEAIVEFVRRTR